MFPCCDMCYHTYLHRDGTINGPLLREARLNARRIYMQSGDAGSTARAIALAEPFTDDNPPCLCDCHREGSGVLH
jgi:hypothetical protein